MRIHVIPYELKMGRPMKTQKEKKNQINRQLINCTNRITKFMAC